MTGRHLYECTWPEAAACTETAKAVVVPTGSCEQHGHHLPLGTDGYIPQEIARRLARRVNVLVAPLLPYGHSSNHARFPGTISISVRAYDLFMRDVVDSFLDQGLTKFVFLNGHSGNTPTLQYLCGHIRDHGGLGVVFDWFNVAGQLSEKFVLSGHADALEAAPLLCSHPDLVHLDRVVPHAVRRLSDNTILRNWSRLEFKTVSLPTWVRTEDASRAGNFGSMDQASPEHGQAIYEAVTGYLVELVEELSKISMG